MRNSWVLFLTLAFIACGEDKEPKPQQYIINIRVKNTSTHNYSSVYFSVSQNEISYGNIKPNESTAYHEFTDAIQSSSVVIKLKIQGDEYVFQPMDFEEKRKGKLASGNYTYEISADPNADHSRLYARLIRE